MTILFILTIGFVLVIGIIAWRVIRSHLEARAKAFKEKRRRARVDLAIFNYRQPSWHDQADRFEEFFAGVELVAMHKGMPSGHVQTVLGKEINVRRLTWYVGSLEEHGANWREQQMAVVYQIIEWFEAEQRAMEWTLD